MTIRIKKIGNNEYYYEQKSVRDGNKVYTEHVRYIGKVGDNYIGTTSRQQELKEIKNKENSIFKIGENKYNSQDTNYISSERYNLKDCKKIGEGRDRIVYELPNGDIIKVAKNPNGLKQNDNETDYYNKLLPDTKENGRDYVVKENIKRDDKKSYQLLKPFKKFNQNDFNKKTIELQDEFNKASDKYPERKFTNAMDYDLAYSDFTSVRNWGWKNNQPYHLDGGTFNKDSFNKSKLTSEDKLEYAQIQSQRRKIKD